MVWIEISCTWLGDSWRKIKKVFENDYQSRPVKVEKVYIQSCKICNKIRQFRIKL